MPEGPAAVRSVVAVGAGFFAIQMLTLGGDKVYRSLAPQAFDEKGFALEGQTLLIAMVYVAFFEVVGGYITARFAGVKPVVHALWLGAFLLLVNGLLTVLTFGKAPLWYQLASLALILPMTVLGGAVHRALTGAPR